MTEQGDDDTGGGLGESRVVGGWVGGGDDVGEGGNYRVEGQRQSRGKMTELRDDDSGNEKKAEWYSDNSKWDSWNSANR